MKKLAPLLFKIIAVAMLLFTVAVVVGYVWINKYLGSEAFRNTLSQTASKALNVEGQFQDFHWSGLSVYSGGFTGRGNATSSFDRILIQNLHASINIAAALRGIVEIDEFEVGQFHLSLKETGPVPPPTSETPAPTPVAPSPASSKFRVDAIRINEVRLDWPKDIAGGGSAAGIAVEMTNAEGGWNIEGHGGTLAYADYPIQKVDHFTMRLRPDRLYITRAELRNGDQGTIKVSGGVGIVGNTDLDLNVDIADFPVSPLLPSDWRARLSGNANSSLHLTRPDAPNAPWKVEGQGHLDGAVLEGLPALDQIATFTQTTDYRTLKLQTVSTDYVFTPAQWDFTNIAIEAPGLIRVEGQLTKAGDALAGKLNLGVPPAKIAIIPGAQTEIFTETRGAYVWTPVVIGGTVESPTEDITPRLLAAAAQVLKKMAQPVLDKTMDLFNQLLH